MGSARDSPLPGPCCPRSSARSCGNSSPGTMCRGRSLEAAARIGTAGARKLVEDARAHPSFLVRGHARVLMRQSRGRCRSMRALIVSDIHANFEALRRVPDRFDRALCLGDLMDYGPDPLPCIRWLRERDAICIRGNHDDAVARSMSCGCALQMREASETTRAWMLEELGAEELEFLRSLPLRRRVELRGREVRARACDRTRSTVYVYASG